MCIARQTLQLIIAVPSVLRRRGKCTTGFSSNCVYMPRGTVTDVGCAKQRSKYVHVAVFPWNYVQTSPRFMKTIRVV